MKGSRAVVEKGFTRTTNGSEAVGPKGPAKAAEAPEKGEAVKKGGLGKAERRFPSGSLGVYLVSAGKLFFLSLSLSSKVRCPVRRVTRLIFRDLVLLGFLSGNALTRPGRG